MNNDHLYSYRLLIVISYSKLHNFFLLQQTGEFHLTKHIRQKKRKKQNTKKNVMVLKTDLQNDGENSIALRFWWQSSILLPSKIVFTGCYDIHATVFIGFGLGFFLRIYNG